MRKLRTSTIRAADSSPLNSSEPLVESQRDLCLACNRSRATCFCGFVTPFNTNTRFVLLMHDKEYKHQKTGTGRMTKRALVNAEIIMGVDFSANHRLNELLADERYFPVVLFPGKGSINLSETKDFVVPNSKQLLILVIDGTWRLAKRIMRLSINLQALPKISFTPRALSRFRIKKQPADHCVSTIEAVYNLLDLLDRSGYEQLDKKHQTLLDAIESLVVFQEKFMTVRRV